MSKKINDMTKIELEASLKRYTFQRRFLLVCVAIIELAIIITLILMWTKVIPHYRSFNLSHTQMMGFYVLDLHYKRKIKDINQRIDSSVA